jgi:DNA-directed RNA polymerase specialized sigma24 family protein
MEELTKYLKALVTLQARVLSETQPGLKMEPLLKAAGLNYREIAGILGKTEAAVAKTISRGR